MPRRSRRKHVVVVGAHSQSILLHVTRVPVEGETVLGWGYEEPLDGGKATNQAVALARLGVPVTLVSVFGDDDRGKEIRRYLESEHIDLRYSIVSSGPTDIGFVVLPDTGIPTIVTSTDKSVQLDRASVMRSEAAFEDASFVVAQLEAPPEAALAAFELAHAVGACTVLNPAPAALLDDRLVTETDILVPNEHEAAILASREVELSESAKLLGDELGIPAVIITAGARGAYIAIRGGEVAHVTSPKVRVVDTTGAGDAFIGALVSQLYRGGPIIEAARFATLYASDTVTRSGTLHAYPDRREVSVRLRCME